jgi:hypothetical protein
MGPHCRELPVTLRIGSLDEGATSLDHEATWLLGHTEQITFKQLWDGDGDLYVDAVLHVPCRHLVTEDSGAMKCAAHGFSRSSVPVPLRAKQPRRLAGDRFRLVDNMRPATQILPAPVSPRGLPVLNGDNPCASAPCRTADNRRGAACCRDLQIEIMCTRHEVWLEALVRSRRSPYLCKVSRPGDFSIEAELISACGYLAEDGITCSLHGRRRADGRPAKPDLCTDWPPKNKGLHPGCVFGPRSRRRS